MPQMTLNNGKQMQMIGLGTYQLTSKVFETVESALRYGYRLIDTAAVYRNERDIGESLAELYPKYNVSRQDLFITSKLGPKDHGLEAAEQACLKSLEALGTDYLDLYLIHWPGVQKLKREDPKNVRLRRESWLALEKLYNSGVVKSIGVSNYNVYHLEQLLEYASVVPAVLQVEFHPQLYQSELLEYCRSKGIVLQAYSSLGVGKLVTDPTVTKIASKHSRTPAQVLLKWALQHGVAVIPKSTDATHIQENLQLMDFEISEQDMATLNGLNCDYHFCWDPDGVV